MKTNTRQFREINPRLGFFYNLLRNRRDGDEKPGESISEFYKLLAKRNEKHNNLDPEKEREAEEYARAMAGVPDKGVIIDYMMFVGPVDYVTAYKRYNMPVSRFNDIIDDLHNRIGIHHVYDVVDGRTVVKYSFDDPDSSLNG